MKGITLSILSVFRRPVADPLVCFSKKYDDESNPTNLDFLAAMHDIARKSDQECPVVFGASERIKLLYKDPKVADGTPQEAAKYNERCRSNC